jgi:AcrR family transcriptional regulator
MAKDAHGVDATGSKERRSRDAEATRLDLLRAAQRRLAVMGYDRTTTRDVADDAGVNPALINRYFGGKEGLYQAVIAAAPDMLADADPVRGDLVTEFLAGLRPEAWPEFGHHPLLLLLRDSSADAEIQTLRSLAMRSTVDRIIEWSGVDAGEPGSPRRRDVELRAQMVQALFSGIVALRFMTPVEPFASAHVDELRGALQDAMDALIGQPCSGRSRAAHT